MKIHIARGRPLGDQAWVTCTAASLDLGHACPF